MPYDIDLDDIDAHITAAWVNVQSAFDSSDGSQLDTSNNRSLIGKRV